MLAKPVVFNFPFHLHRYKLFGSRYLPWINEDIILAFDFGRWLNAYIAKNLPSIDKAAHRQGKFFYYHPRDGKLNPQYDEFYAKPDEVFKDFIHYRFFNYQYGPNVAFLRRLDDTRFLAWLTTDIVKKDGNIYWPSNLFDNLADILYINAIGEDPTSNTGQERMNDTVDAEFQLSDPNVSFDAFEKHMYSCQECQIEEAVYIEKGFDFYNVMETEYPCARCKKESYRISSGDLIYRWREIEWHPEVASIPLAMGYCLDCRPYFESNINQLLVECNICGTVMLHDTSKEA